jgi:DNA-directed RNA polymerase sigma subunit (sigma70/sigma32)
MKIKSKEDMPDLLGTVRKQGGSTGSVLNAFTHLYIQEGFSLQQIADQFGISKQRVHQILLKESKEPELLAV